jgi:hypothetical protein
VSFGVADASQAQQTAAYKQYIRNKKIVVKKSARGDFDDLEHRMI